jgi:hypothetical protein
MAWMYRVAPLPEWTELEDWLNEHDGQGWELVALQPPQPHTQIARGLEAEAAPNGAAVLRKPRP